ncbi:DNA methylase [Mycobacterium phage Eyeball]|nr:DNA methylase [Mycobacterium phage Eyeball]
MSNVDLRLGDCRDILTELEDASVDSIVTDPPYELGFMGKKWDGSGIAFDVEMWEQCLRVLKPGGHLLAFGGSRTWHRLTVAIEDAGFEIRGSIAWLYGSGFPKSLDVSKAIDKAAGAEREVIGTKLGQPGYSLAENVNEGRTAYGTFTDSASECAITAPATDAAKRWSGWGTALKPAFEPIVVARKPLAGTVAANVLEHGTGALNIDACRIETTDDLNGGAYAKTGNRTVSGSLSPTGMNVPGKTVGKEFEQPSGRWPTNVALDDTQAAELDAQTGITISRKGKPRTGANGHGWGMTATGAEYDDEGGASRFFPVFKYQAKAPTKERPSYVNEDGNKVAHSTVKPLTLMRWLARLVCPPGGVILDPFAGSGTTVEACLLEGFDCIAIENEADYIPLIEHRISRSTT